MYVPLRPPPQQVHEHDAAVLHRQRPLQLLNLLDAVDAAPNAAVHAQHLQAKRGVRVAEMLCDDQQAGCTGTWRSNQVAWLRPSHSCPANPRTLSSMSAASGSQLNSVLRRCQALSPCWSPSRSRHSRRKPNSALMSAACQGGMASSV